MGNDIILMAEIATAILTLSGFIGGIWKMFKKINDFQENLNYNTLISLKLLIINEQIPLDERVMAGEKYISLGGNGAIKQLVNKLTEELANEYVE